MAKAHAQAFFLEEAYWDFLDAAKDLFAVERWQGVLMDCSKNELLALVHVYRVGETTMSRIAAYVGVPLNTATGIANRLERRGLVERWRSEQDKRVMEVRITEQGLRQVSEVIKCIGELAEKVMGDLDTEERRVLMKIMGKVPQVLAGETAVMGKAQQQTSMKRITIE